MTKYSQNLLNGNKKEKELRVDFLRIKGLLPDNWVRVYINTFCQHLCAMDAVDEYNKMRNIKSGRSTPEPSQLKNIKKLVDSAVAENRDCSTKKHNYASI